MDEAGFLLKEKYGGEKSPAYEEDLKRLEGGEPLAYLIGWIPFLDSKIYLDSRPLIPRPETEFWTEKAIDELSGSSFQVLALEEKRHIKVLDLFAGSGCIGVAVLTHVPNAHVDFGEIDPAHFPTIKKNITECETYDVSHIRTRIIETDVWSGITDSYDIVLANPPYLSPNRKDRMGLSVIEHEPSKALFADEDGLALIRKTIEGASEHVNENGTLYIEHEPEQTEAISQLAKDKGFDVLTKLDQYGIKRYSVLRRL